MWLKKRIINNANMELKSTNPNDDKLVVRNPNKAILFFLKIVRIGFKNIHCILLFSRRYLDCPQKKSLILSTSLINIEWIKVANVDMDVFHKKKEFNDFWKFFW
jgi:hypothetical protein